jgi:hypothetical protein
MITKEILYDLHYNQKLSSIKIAELYSITDRTVRNWFYKYGLELIGNTFNKGRSNPKNKIKTIEQLEFLKKVNVGRVSKNKGCGNVTHKCCVCNKEFSDKPYRRKKYCSKICMNNAKGENHFRYKGLENRGIQTKRNWIEYKILKKEIHKRDNNKCRICGDIGEHMHHIKSWKEFPLLRFDESNIILLCKNCHNEIHKICGRNNYSHKKFFENYVCVATNTWKRAALSGF